LYNSFIKLCINLKLKNKFGGNKMKQLKKFYSMLALALVLTVVAPSVMPLHNVAVVSAATIKLSKKDLTLEVGKTKKLTVTGTKAKVTWSTSKKSVATVSKSGNVTAVKPGKAVITATVNKKKYTCKVTVTEAVNPNVANAPFEAVEFAQGNLKFVMPKDWTQSVIAQQGPTTMYLLYPTSADVNVGTSNVTLTITETGTAKADYEIFKEYLEGYITEDLIKTQFEQAGLEATVSDFATSDYDSKLGKVFKTYYKSIANGVTMTQTIYDLSIDNYTIEVSVTNIGDNVTPDVTTVGEYLLNTISVAK
jgi:hypothetical protein